MDTSILLSIVIFLVLIVANILALVYRINKLEDAVDKLKEGESR